MFYETLAQVAKLIFFLIVGFVLTKKSILPEQTPKCFSVFLVWVSCPALYLCTFSTQFTVETLAESAKLIGLGAATLAAAYTISILLKRVITKDEYSQDVFSYSVCVPNFGYIGYVLVLALFGEVALMKYQIFTIPFTVFVITKGYAMLLERKISFKGFFNPMFIAMLVGMAIGLAGIKLPEFLVDALNGASGCMGPVSMVLTGCVIAQFDLKKILSLKEIYSTVAVRMVLMPLLVIAASLILDIPKEYLGYMMLLQTLPAGLNSVVYPCTIGRDCSFGAGLALISNIAAIITVPLFLTYLS